MKTPEYNPLSANTHHDIAVAEDSSFSHARAFNLVNIGFNEIATLSGCMPLVVVNNDDNNSQTLACVVGSEGFGNLFCGTDAWLGHAVPLSIQSHPFNFAFADNHKVSVLLNVNDERIQHKTTHPEYALFSADGQPTLVLKRYQECLTELISGLQQSEAFLAILNEHNLLSPLSVTVTRQDGQIIESANLLSIDDRKFASLSESVIVRFHQQGLLMAVNAMILSLRQYNRIVQLTQHHPNPAVKVGIKLSNWQ